MFNIIWRSLKDRKISLAVYAAASSLFTWMYIAMYPSILKDAATFEQAFANYPTELFEAFGIEELSFDTIEKFLALEHYSIVFPIMLLFLMLSFAGSALAGEVDKGTIEHILAKPVSRLKLFFSRYISGLVTLATFTGISVFIAIPLAMLHDIDYVVEGYVYIFLLSMLFGWAVFSIGYMFSALFSDKGRVYMFSGGLFLLMYVANVASALMEKLENVQYLSFFYYYDYNNALQDATIDWLPAVVFAGTAIICTTIGAIYYHKRDIAV